MRQCLAVARDQVLETVQATPAPVVGVRVAAVVVEVVFLAVVEVLVAVAAAVVGNCYVTNSKYSLKLFSTRSFSASISASRIVPSSN